MRRQGIDPTRAGARDALQRPHDRAAPGRRCELAGRRARLAGARVRFGNGEPLLLETFWVPRAVCPEPRPARARPSGSLYDADAHPLRRRPGAAPHETIEPTACEPDDARHLSDPRRARRRSWSPARPTTPTAARSSSPATSTAATAPGSSHAALVTHAGARHLQRCLARSAQLCGWSPRRRSSSRSSASARAPRSPWPRRRTDTGPDSTSRSPTTRMHGQPLVLGLGDLLADRLGAQVGLGAQAGGEQLGGDLAWRSRRGGRRPAARSPAPARARAGTRRAKCSIRMPMNRSNAPNSARWIIAGRCSALSSPV